MLGLIQQGSPPRAWGQPARHLHDGSNRRFTPTRVGTTSPSWTAFRALAVHPHARGDNLWWGSFLRDRGGSPPRAWGQRSVWPTAARRQRFTPTRVGTTRRLEVVNAELAVHPHARGDNEGKSELGGRQWGSPPRAWGQHIADGLDLVAERFTPTRVGTTSTSLCLVPGIAVHPHARGDNSASTTTGRLRNGSPPRAWGQRSRRIWLTDDNGSPPRAWGQRAPSAVLSPRSGSPPRAWGQRDGNSASNRLTDFTPTRVGTTYWGILTDAVRAVHPHARGDNFSSRS